jgi:hypothetical protein
VRTACTQCTFVRCSVGYNARASTCSLVFVVRFGFEDIVRPSGVLNQWQAHVRSIAPIQWVDDRSKRQQLRCEVACLFGGHVHLPMPCELVQRSGSTTFTPQRTHIYICESKAQCTCLLMMHRRDKPTNQPIYNNPRELDVYRLYIYASTPPFFAPPQSTPRQGVNVLRSKKQNKSSKQTNKQTKQLF